MAGYYSSCGNKMKWPFKRRSDINNLPMTFDKNDLIKFNFFLNNIKIKMQVKIFFDHFQEHTDHPSDN